MISVNSSIGSIFGMEGGEISGAVAPVQRGQSATAHSAETARKIPRSDLFMCPPLNASMAFGLMALYRYPAIVCETSFAYVSGSALCQADDIRFAGRHASKLASLGVDAPACAMITQ